MHYAIIGAVALNLHGLARATEDLDILVEPEAGNIERLKLALHDAIDDPDIEGITAADLLGEYPAVHLLVTAVTPRMLYLMKRDTVGVKDRADAAAIRQQFDVGE